MATILWAQGDVFTFDGGSGIVIGNNMAVLVTGTPRTRYTVERGNIPEDAQPTRIEGVSSEVKMALKGARAAIGL